MADLNIPSLKGLFEPRQGKPPIYQPKISPGTVDALQNPEGEVDLHNLQKAVEKKELMDRLTAVSSSLAKMHTDKIRPDLQNMATDVINDFQSKANDRYAKNQPTTPSGMGGYFNKYQLSPKQLLDQAADERAMQSDINTLNTYTSDYESILKEGIKDVGQGRIDPKEFNDWNESVKKGIKDATENKKKPGDLLNLQISYSQMVHPREKPEDLLKRSAEYEKDIVNTPKYKNRTTPVSTKEAAQDISNEYPVGSKAWKDYRKIKEGLGIVDPADDDETALNKISKTVAPSIKFSREQAPPTIIYATPTQNPQGGLDHPPLPAYKGKTVSATINGQQKKVEFGPYNDQTGQVTVYPEKKSLLPDVQKRISTQDYIINNTDGKSTKEDIEQAKKAKADHLASDKSYTKKPDYDNPESVHINDVVGGEDFYREKKVKGTQKLNVPAKAKGDTYIVNGTEYTKDELGWSDDQIQQAIKAKKIQKK
jgi:hypothetical protein